MRQNFGILIELQIVARTVALVSAHDRSEGGHFGPAHDEFRGSNISKKARVTADIRMMIGIAEEPGGQRARDDRDETVVTREIHGLIASPQQRTIFLNACESGSHEEQNIAGSPSSLDRARIHFGPKRWPGVVHQLRIDPVGQVDVEGKVLAEIGHPSRQAEVDHVTADHALGEPFRRFRIGEVDDAALKLAEIHECRLALVVHCKITRGIRFQEKRAVDGKIRIHIAEEPNAPVCQLCDALRQTRVSLLVRLPVPEQPRPERCMAQANPVFAPEAGDLDSGGNHRFEPIEGSRAVLEADDCAAIEPVRKGWLATEALGERLDQTWEARPGR